MGEANTLGLMASLDLPPAMSYAVVLLASPVCLADSRDPFVSSHAQAGADLGRAVFWAALARASRAAESFWAGPVAD